MRLKKKEHRSNGCQLLGHDMVYLGGLKIFREKKTWEKVQCILVSKSYLDFLISFSKRH